MNPTPRRLLLAASILALPAAALAQAPCTDQRLLASDPEAAAHYGSDVDVDGDWAVVGAADENNTNGTNNGAAYVLKRTGGVWAETQKLVIPAGMGTATNDHFGASVAIDGSTIAVGAPVQNGPGFDAGAVYVFRRDGAGDTFAFLQKIQPADIAEGDHFGEGLDLDGAWLVAGAPNADRPPSVAGNPPDADTGAVYLFHRPFLVSAFSQHSRVLPSDAAPGDRFGAAVAIESDRFVAGAPGAALPGGSPADAGAAYVYVRTSSGPIIEPTFRWSLEARLETPIQRFSQFSPLQERIPGSGGASVAIRNGRVAVGLPDSDASVRSTTFPPTTTAVPDVGWVAVYERDGAAWPLTRRLAGGVGGSHFGRHVALTPDLVLVGIDEGNAGVQAYDAATGEPHAAIERYGAATNAFAGAVAASNDAVIVGDVGFDAATVTDAGAAYLFTLPPVLGESCAEPIPAAFGTTVACNVWVEDADPVTCSGTQRVVNGPLWFAVTSACPGRASVHADGSDFRAVVSVHETMCGPPVACALGPATPGGTGGRAVSPPGTQFFVRVGGVTESYGAVRLTVEPFVEDDSCAGAAEVLAADFGTCFATPSSPAVPAGAGCPAADFGRDVWYAYTATAPVQVNLDVCGENLLAAVYAGGCPADASTRILCTSDTDGCAPAPTRHTFLATAGSTFRLRLGERTLGTPATGSFAITTTAATTGACCSPANTTCLVRSSEDCAFLGGTFRGLATACAPTNPCAAPTSGACCTGTTCTVATSTTCNGGQFQGPATSCGPVGNPTTCCPANFDRASGVGVVDIFAFLSAWFAQGPGSDFDRSGSTTVVDIFAFLGAWFAGC